MSLYNWKVRFQLKRPFIMDYNLINYYLPALVTILYNNDFNYFWAKHLWIYVLVTAHWEDMRLYEVLIISVLSKIELQACVCTQGK